MCNQDGVFFEGKFPSRIFKIDIFHRFKYIHKDLNHPYADELHTIIFCDRDN
jgi:hypothetical protein